MHLLDLDHLGAPDDPVHLVLHYHLEHQQKLEHHQFLGVLDDPDVLENLGHQRDPEFLEHPVHLLDLGVLETLVLPELRHYLDDLEIPEHQY